MIANTGWKPVPPLRFQMRKAEPMRKILAILIASALATAPVYAVKIADITRIDGQRTNKLTGIGLVTGLKGTGDGGDYLPAIRPLAVMLGAFSNETEVRELGDVQNIALVGLSVTLPKDGVHIGDQLDVQVTSWGKATSLKNGSLVNCPMMGPKPEPNGKLWAMAQGLVVVDDPTSPTSGVIKGGCTVERSLEMHYIFNGKLKLFLEEAHASWTTAGAIAQVINDSEANGKDVIATVIDPKTVEISIPLVEREQPVGFIGRIQRLSVPERLLNTEARVVVNDKTHTMIFTGDVEISPTIISQQGLTITTISPERKPTDRNPIVTTKQLVPIDTTNTGGAKLQDLVTALDQLKVPAEDRITIIKELYRSGKLHAKLITEN